MTTPLRAMFLLSVMAMISAPAQAAPGDTTWVRTFDHDFYNWATAHEQTFTFPDSSIDWRQILLHYTIGCPEAPNDCDPWDRLGWVQVLKETGDGGGGRGVEPFEIARIITPYDITGGSRPDSCTWVLDVSDYESLLHGEVTLRSYIESWIGGNNGWLVTIDFAFIEGLAPTLLEPVRVVNLWSNYHAVYGDPGQPIDDHLQPVAVDVGPEVESAKVRVITTGHGQGNTDNCAEFCPKEHSILAGADAYAHTLWRSDCSQNTCSPQGGTWYLQRAGWCPGDKVDPWDIDVTASVTPGGEATFDYNVEDYFNFCCTCNPDCVSGVTCTDCMYNSTGHTEPHYSIQAQLILYETSPVASAGEAARAAAPRLFQNSPNPFRPSTWITYSIARAGEARLFIYDAAGRVIRTISRDYASAGTYRVSWDGKDARGRDVPAGVYFYGLRGAEAAPRKMILIR